MERARADQLVGARARDAENGRGLGHRVRATVHEELLSFVDGLYSFQGRAKPRPDRRVEGGRGVTTPADNPRLVTGIEHRCGDIQGVRGGWPRRTRSRTATAVTNRGLTTDRRRSDNRDRYDNRDARSRITTSDHSSPARPTIST
jgi:hypothetical protein